MSKDPVKPERLSDYLQDAIKRIDMASQYLSSASPEMQDRLCDEDDDAIEVNMLRDALVRCIEVVGQCLPMHRQPTQSWWNSMR